MRTRLLVLPAAVLLLVTIAMVMAQPRSGGAPSADQIRQNMGRMLDEVRSDPTAKSRALSRLHARMSADGVSDAEVRLAEIGRILDEAANLSEAEYANQRSELVARLVAQIRGESASGTADSLPVIPWIDVHDHLVATRGDYTAAAAIGARTMEQSGMLRMVVMPPPQVAGMPRNFDCEAFTAAIRPYGARYAFLGGGGTLNVMIHQTDPAKVDERVRRQFTERAAAILAQGAVGFGEIAIRHLSLHGSEHPFEDVAGDHPLLLLLADIAAEQGVPIDLHLDVLTHDMPLPASLTSPNNPRTLRANLAGFERLLAHNPRARIIWEHAGSDQLGDWSVELSRRLLKTYPNLYLGLRLGPGHAAASLPLTADGRVKDEWLRLLQDFPSRFVIGDDEFVGDASGGGGAGKLSGRTPKSRTNVRVFLNALPPDLARKIATENATALYRFP